MTTEPRVHHASEGKGAKIDVTVSSGEGDITVVVTDRPDGTTGGRRPDRDPDISVTIESRPTESGRGPRDTPGGRTPSPRPAPCPPPYYPKPPKPNTDCEHLTVTPKVLRKHAKDVDRAAADVDACRTAGMTVAFDLVAYGVLCQQMGVTVAALSANVLSGLHQAQCALSAGADSLRDTADIYEGVDCGAGDRFSGIEGRLQ